MINGNAEFPPAVPRERRVYWICRPKCKKDLLIYGGYRSITHTKIQSSFLT